MACKQGPIKQWDQPTTTFDEPSMHQAYNEHTMVALTSMGQPSNHPKTVAKHAQNGDQNAIQIMRSNEPKPKALKRVTYHHYQGHS